MRKSLLLILISLFFFTNSEVIAQTDKEKDKPKVDTRIDNMRYWNEMIKQGHAKGNPVIKIEPAIYRGVGIDAKSVKTEDSPDVAVSSTEETETSVFVHPNDNNYVMNSNNSGNSSTFYGANFFYSDDGGATWGGQVEGAGGSNSGDPATAIGLGGRVYVGYIHNNYGQGVSFSDNDGTDWTNVQAGTNPGSMLDKNHLWIDNSPSSPYEGYVYDAWTDFGGTYDSEIGFVRTTDGGTNYSSKIILSLAVNAGSHNQGVNINSGPNGEVYVVWSIYDSWPSDETALAFAKSTDGGATFPDATRILSNIKGIRTSEVSKNHRVNSFPSMAVDISGSTYNGNLYIVWTNIGVPGTNTGTNRSVYIIKSTDQGDTWGTPVRVNQGPFQDGKEAYFPWITCDPESGVLSVIFYDDRDVSSSQVETWVANSYDGGDTWEDFRVSDVAFTPAPLPGMAGGYMGDYLGISARGGMVYPMWPDNRNGSLLTYVSPFETNTRAKPTDLNIVLTEASGQVDLTWSYTETKTLQHFVIYRDDVQIGTTTETFYTDMLPDYGLYEYSVTAMHDDGESSSANGSIQWGNPDISVSPTSLTETLLPDQTSTKVLTISNTGELDLIYNIATAITSKGNNNKAYCDAGGGGDEYISGVVFGSINNTGTGEDGYADYTAMSTDVDAGNTYPITVTNGNVYSTDDLGVWVDWNQDEDFDDAGENPVCESSNSGQGTYDISVPADALGGQTRMRVRIKYFDDDCGAPCGTTTYGEVEDYSVNVNSWLQVETMSGIVSPGSSEMINVNFNSTDLALGDYFATITINSNDGDEPAVDVPVTLHVTDDASLNTSASADDYVVCVGSSTILHANASGGTGIYTFSWTSNPAGFTSTEENPTVSPTEYTVYTVVVDDGIDFVSSDVIIDVSDIPGQASTPTGEVSLCEDPSNTLYETTDVTGADSYLWSISPGSAGTISGTGTTGNVDWANDFTGEATIAVSAANTCGSGTESDAITVTVNASPDVSLDPFANVEVDDPAFELTGGSPTGGDYSGTGVNSGFFDPAVAGVGTHTITYTYTNGSNCADFDQQDIVVDEDSGIEGLMNGISFDLYPNPNNGTLFINISSEKDYELIITIVNQIGVIVKEENISTSNNSNNQLDLNNLASGIYFINIKSDLINVTRKIVVQK